MSENARTYEFGDFVFVPSESQLFRGAELLPLPPKAFAVLDVLVSNPGRLVEKDDLIADVWEGSFVEESTVARNVWLIRQALDDNGKTHEYIQTVPKRGYRFIARVDVSDARLGPTAPAGDPTRESTRRTALNRYFIAGGLLLLLLAVGAAYFIPRTRSGPPAFVRGERGTTSEAAHRLYQQGLFAYEKRTPEEAQKAVALFDEAIRIDPAYARAWAGKGRAVRYAAAVGGESIHDRYRDSEAAISRALALDPMLSEAYSFACENKLSYEYDLPAAESDCLRALELDSKSSVAYEVYARFLTSRGRHAEAILASKAAIDIEPSVLFYQRNYGVALFYARRYDEAVIQLKRVIEMEDRFEAVFPWLLAALQMDERYDEAFESFVDSPSSAADPEKVRAYRAIYQQAGWQGFLQEYARDQSSTGGGYFLKACHNARAGFNDVAFDLLEKSLDRREWGIAYLDVDPRLDTLRDDPRFESLVARAGIRR